MHTPVKLALVGPSAVGKDTLAEYLVSQYGFTHISTGALLREYIREHHLGEPTREILRNTAIELRRAKGADYFVREASTSTAQRLVVSGIRAIPEVECFKEMQGIVVGITAPIERRYALAKQRGDVADHISFEDFQKLESLEDTGDDREAPNVQGVMRYADHLIVNDGSRKDLFKKMDDIVLIC